MGWAARQKIGGGNPVSALSGHKVGISKSDRLVVTMRTGTYVRQFAGGPLRRATADEMRQFALARAQAQATARSIKA